MTDKKDKLKVAIQGVRASFHDVAAKLYFAGQEIVPVECSSFTILSNALKNQEADCAVMAIENSIAGSILPNYQLLENYGFRISGEIYLRIEMSLLALKGTKIEDLRLVQSHPMALFQCTEFLTSLPAIKIIEASDTAESAKNVAEFRLPNVAAIASYQCAEEYGLEVLARGIETNKMNYTRFLIIHRGNDAPIVNGANKASIQFEAAHKPGSLASILDILSRHHVNMTKLQSVPILGRPYQYSFHVDVEWSDTEEYRKSIVEISKQTSKLIQFGEYKTGDKPFL